MSNGILSGFDRAVLKKTVTDGVLERVCEEKIESELGGEAVVVACGDGKQRADITDHLKKKGLSRSHDVTGNGGPLPLGPGSPAASLNRMLPEFLEHITKETRYKWLVRLTTGLLTMFGCLIRIDLIQLIQIWKGLEIQRMETIILMPHVPCGIAGYYNLDVIMQFKLIVGAKSRLRKFFPGKRVMLLIHVDWGDEDQDPRFSGKKTYRFSGEKILRWISQEEAYLFALKARL
ncbi:MAG: hypothetical protein A2537_03185 [Candidatus Magasanikbacteria bacterium RIFOXYD2_FULL_36_9]|uniref:Uncharacterized protein n=1 Tax=Candidatus Magasanikbacteria bacterium RIFOXYD2_FULL_36_9 TaxID=1798707 RepID=A0A1F6NY11_9BACT|nr:MAG: hypothetical protein A2537_03185 [Candidatus Magasanikbacteria bacterium RIFOXYD2_FULL_36_9]